MRILLLSATPFEVEPTVNFLRARATEERGNVLVFPRVEIEVIFGGVGLTSTAFVMGQRLAGRDRPDLCLQAGIGGAYEHSLALGQVVRVTSERFGDLGAEDADGNWLSLADIGLPPGPPFGPAGELTLPPGAVPLPGLDEVSGLSVNRASGSQRTIDRIRAAFPEVAVESMEGAAFFYACLSAGLEPVQLRAISNYVEPRNREAWRMREAITALNDTLRQLLGSFLGVE